MINIESKINDLNSFFNTLKSEIGGTLSINNTEHKLDINNDLGNGSIRSILLEDGLAVLEFNLTVHQNLQITIDTPLSTHVNFIYCSKGKLSQMFGQNSETNTIEAFQTSIVSNIASPKNVIVLEKGVETTATLISVNTSYNENNTSQWSTSLKNAFISDKTEDFIYIGSYNLKIAENVKQLRSIKQEGLVRALLTKGIVNIVLALEIEQHNRDIENADMSAVSLTKAEFKLIQELSEFINKHPDLDHKVENLTRKVGLSAAKIQEGFKFKHDLTICEYIRCVRLTKSEDLISNTDLNISEVVYSLGFTSRSYFSKIFKERFNCTPSEYKKKNKLAVSA